MVQQKPLSDDRHGRSKGRQQDNPRYRTTATNEQARDCAERCSEQSRMETPTDTFLPNSDPIYGCVNANGHREDYFTQIVRSNYNGRDGQQQNHNIAVGDIVAIRDVDEGVKSTPWKEKTVLGQVLTLFVRREAVNRSTYHVTVRRLARWKGEFSNFATKAAETKFNKEQGNFFRPDQALFETMKVETHALQDVLRADVQILHHSFFLTTDKKKAQWDATTQSHIVQRCCPARIDGADKFHNVSADWNSYENRRRSSSLASSKGSKNSPPPAALVRGWQLLSDPKLVQKLQSSWNVRSEEFFYHEPDKNKENKKRKASDYQSTASRKSRPNRSVTFAPTPPSARPPKKKKRKVGTGKRKSSISNESMTLQDSTTADETLSDASSMQVPHHVALRSKPVGEPVYVTHPKGSPSTVFVESVEMDLNENALAYKRAGGGRKKKTARWKFHVGDIVILHCDETTAPAVPFVPGKKSNWYPFRDSWSVVQVVALYYRNDDEKEMMMQVRWFYRPDELTRNVDEHLTSDQRKEFFEGEYQSRVLVEVDEHITEVPAESALGSAKVTSERSPSEEWLKPNLTNTVPEIGFVCRYMYISKTDDAQLHPVRDWTNYGKNSTRPLFRGINCPKCKPGKSAKLLQRYKDRLCTILAVTELEESNVLDEIESEEDRDIEWSQEEMDCAEATCSPAHCCYSNKQNEFFTSTNVQVVKGRCDARGMAKKSGFQEVRVSIGDIVCIASSPDETKRTVAFSRQKNPWFPFRGPFIFAQVLNIYRQSAKRQLPIMLEVRHFYRRGEVRHLSQNYLPPDCARDQEEEVIESFDIDTVPAGRVLGLAEMFLGHHTENYRTKSNHKNSTTMGMFRPKCRASFYTTKVALQQFYCTDPAVVIWSRRMLERGLSASTIICNDSDLANTLEFCLAVSISSGQVPEKINLFQSLIDETKRPSEALPLFKRPGGVEETSFYASISIGINWSDFVDEKRLCSRRDRQNCLWKVIVGSVVAIRKEDEKSACEIFYRADWEPAQVIAISSDSDEPNQRSYRFHVRRLRRSGKESLMNSFPGSFCEAENNIISTVTYNQLLGPIYVASEANIFTVWGNAIPYLPANVMIPEGRNAFDLSSFVKEGLDVTNFYSDDETELLLNELDEQLPGFSKLQIAHESIGSSLDGTPNAPRTPAQAQPTPAGHLYEDTSGTQYFSRVTVEPSTDDFVEEIRKGRSRFDGPWTVQLGDIVAIQYHDGCGGANNRCLYPSRKIDWAICEVVAIFENKHSSEDCIDDRVELEVRWYYRAKDIKLGSELLSESLVHDREEIFETDHYDIVPASTLFFPIKLQKRGAQTAQPMSQNHAGLPIEEFRSFRFWSTKRKSLVPVDDTDEGRVKRARQYSSTFQQDAGLRDSVEAKLGLTQNSSTVISKCWRSSFCDVIQKLSLTDASKEGFKSTKAIVGRDKEMKHILSFLRTALNGSSKEGHRSLFIAGPPGVGKTACVRAAISELEHLRAKGQVPSFEFVCMNGMEMRYPFEAYVQLWEKISGKAVKPEFASAKLEAYFTKEESVATREAKCDSGSVVVLLDEIDYLVTKNQSVLYNFFDWPTHNRQRRLIVLGVSNTLNLAEQLHTRVQSRIGSRRCIFKAYDAIQIEKILRVKLRQASPGYTVFDDDAIVFVSKKTASLSGDIRRAFQICRTAAEHVMRQHCESEKDPLVSIGDALKVSRESFHSAKSQAVTRCTAFEALLLVSVASLSKSTGREFGGFDMEEILVKMEALANGLGDERYLPTPTLAEAMDVVSRLAEGNIVSAVTPKSTSLTYRASLAGSGGPWPLVSLTVDDLSVLLALKKSPHKALAQKYLGLSGF